MVNDPLAYCLRPSHQRLKLRCKQRLGELGVWVGFGNEDRL